MALWKVTTENDCEGRTMKELGYYEGNPIDIAFVLSDKAMYSLSFTEVSAAIITPDELEKSTRDEVNLTFAMDSIYSACDDIVSFVNGFFIENRPVYVDSKRAFNSITLKKGVPDKNRDLELARKQALSKLTEDEKVLLGLA